jgi:Arc/MetJ family transcription regulator
MTTLNNTTTPTTLDELLSADAMQRLNVDLDRQTYADLKAYAKAHKKTLSRVVRAMIKLHLTAEKIQ